MEAWSGNEENTPCLVLINGWREHRTINSPFLIADYHRIGICPTWWLASDVSTITALKIFDCNGLSVK
jgi:hypothetical protein